MNAATDAAPQVQRRLAPEVRRRQIVTETARLISAAGYNAVSLADIADACGIRKPSVLHHFPTMTDLLAAVLEYRDELSYSMPHKLEDYAGPAKASKSFRLSVEHNRSQRELVRLFVVLRVEAMDTSHPAHNYFRERERTTLDGFTRVLQWKRRPKIAARELYSFWTGLETYWVADPAADMLEVWDAFAERFFVED